MRLAVIGGTGLVDAKLVTTLRHRGVSPAFVQPIAADEVAAALADLVAAPRNDMIEHAVIADSRARYFGAELNNDSLTSDEGAIIGVMRFDEWLKQHASALRVEGLGPTSSFPSGAAHKPDFRTRVPRARIFRVHARSFPGGVIASGAGQSHDDAQGRQPFT